MTRASGTFTVTSTPHPPYDTEPGATLGRVTFQKQFEGDLSATSVVEMLSAMTEVNGSAAYVALERVRGSLGGRQGSFVLSHTGIMKRGSASLTVTVVPDSATHELTGLHGTMSISIADGVHSYAFDYSLEGD
jgi:hypothetical protein